MHRSFALRRPTALLLAATLVWHGGSLNAWAVDSNFTPAGVAGPNNYTWSTPGNWNAGVPNAAGDIATFQPPADLAIRTVDLTSNVTLGTLRFINNNSNNLQETILNSSTGSKLIFLQNASGGAAVLTTARATGGGDAQEASNQINVPVQIGLNNGNVANASQLFLNVGYRRDAATGLILGGGIIGDVNSSLQINNQGSVGNSTGFGYANVELANSPQFQGSVLITAGGLRIKDNSLSSAKTVTVGFGGQLQIDGTPANVNFSSPTSTLTMSGPGKVTSAGADRGANADGALRYQSTSGTTNLNSYIDINGGAIWTSGQGAGTAIFVNAADSTYGTLNLTGRITGANNPNGTNRAITKEGGGVLELSSSIGSFYEGGTWVREGTLLINNLTGSGSATGRRFVTVDPGAKLGGSGSIDTTLDLSNSFEPLTTNAAMTPNGARSVTISGSLAPGLSPVDGGASFANIGRININTDALVFTSTGTLDVDLGGTVAGTSYDRVQVSGPVTLAGTLNAHLTNNYHPTIGDSFTVLTFSSSTGNFDSYGNLYVGGFVNLVPHLNATNLTLVARPAVDGDVSLDGVVNAQDLAQTSSNWLTAGPRGDANGDGVVNAQDLAIISSHWLNVYHPPVATANAVPEPSSVTLVLVMAGLLGLRSRRFLGRLPYRSSNR